MARVKVNILGISELRWTGMGEFNSDDHFIYYCGQESLRRNIISIIVKKKKRVWRKEDGGVVCGHGVHHSMDTSGLHLQTQKCMQNTG